MRKRRTLIVVVGILTIIVLAAGIYRFSPFITVTYNRVDRGYLPKPYVLQYPKLWGFGGFGLDVTVSNEPPNIQSPMPVSQPLMTLHVTGEE